MSSRTKPAGRKEPAHRRSTGSLQRLLVLPSAGKHLHTFIFLHGFKMKAEEMLDVFVWLSKRLTTWRFVLPQAPMMAISAHGGEETYSWFDYLTDNAGSKEDTVDIFSLRSMRFELQQLIATESALFEGDASLVIGGLSQGGNMALHLAANADFKAVVTAVACRLSQSMPRDLRCPWYALIASRDDVFPSSWSKMLMEGATKTKIVDDSHYLENTDVQRFFLEILGMIEEKPPLQSSAS
jgi:predicted esterase